MIKMILGGLILLGLAIWLGSSFVNKTTPGGKKPREKNAMDYLIMSVLAVAVCFILVMGFRAVGWFCSSVNDEANTIKYGMGIETKWFKPQTISIPAHGKRENIWAENGWHSVVAKGKARVHIPDKGHKDLVNDVVYSENFPSGNYTFENLTNQPVTVYVN